MSDDNLEPLITQCPNCETRFRVTEGQLQVAAGRVRCGACLTVFEGTAHLIMDGEELAPESDTDVDALLEELDGVGDRGRVTALPDIDADDLAVVGEADIGAGAGEAVPDELAELEAQFMAELRTGSASAPVEGASAGHQAVGAEDLDRPIPEPLGVDVPEPDGGPAENAVSSARPADEEASPAVDMPDGDAAGMDAPPVDTDISAETPLADVDVDDAVIEAFGDGEVATEVAAEDVFAAGEAADRSDVNDAAPESEAEEQDLAAADAAGAVETREDELADAEIVEDDTGARPGGEDALDDAMLNDPAAWLESVTEETWPEADEASTTAAETVEIAAVAVDDAETELVAETSDAASSYEMEAFSEPARRRSWLTLGLSLLLLLSLPVQVLWFQYDSWVKDPETRPIYAFICGYLDCQLPALADVSQISSRRSFIRAHPERDDARIVDVLMVNNADFPQPYPLIELTATSMQGQLIAGRRFKPEEYLQGDASADALMPAKTPVHVSLEIQDPGEQAMNFEVQFR